MPIPNIPTPNPIQDGFSLLTSAIRGKIQARAHQDIQPLPSKAELQKRNDAAITPVSATNTDWKAGTKAGNNGVYDASTTSNQGPEGRIDRNLIIKDLVTFEQIKIQFVPQELDYNPESDFKSIASMGRNNPFYHFTGSEDTLKFTLDWFAEQENREDVILNCKKLEALSKNDAYNGPPHNIKLIWNSQLFSEAQWLVVAAPYKLSMFQAHRNMLPQQAYQFVTLKKVTPTNLSSSDIRRIGT